MFILINSAEHNMAFVLPDYKRFLTCIKENVFIALSGETSIFL